MWSFLLSKKPEVKPSRFKGSEKRQKGRIFTAQKAVLCSHQKFKFNIIDMSVTGARLSGPPLREIFGSKVNVEHPLEFLIHYGGAKYKRVRALVRWTHPNSKTFGIQFVD